MTDWLVYRGTETRPNAIEHLPDPPPWRTFGQGAEPVELRYEPDPPNSRRYLRAFNYRAGDEEIEQVNAALYLRRPLLVTGRPGTGKSTLAYSVALQLGLGPVLYWPITSRTTSRDGLYRYDAIARLQDSNLLGQSGDREPPPIGRYVRLGPLGTAFLPYDKPRVLLIDELDKSNNELPDDLLTLFEEGSFEIPELARVADREPEVEVLVHDGTDRVPIRHGRVECHEFPFVVITSNAERDFPPAFLRRCIQLTIGQPDRDRLAEIVRAHLGDFEAAGGEALIDKFMERRSQGQLATDQLLNAIYLHYKQAWPGNQRRLIEKVMQHLDAADGLAGPDR